MNIFLDLDGTLLESRPRLYHLFQHLVPASSLSYDQYWTYKRNKIDHKTMLRDQFGYAPEQIALFEKEWLGMIELGEWLDYDKPFPGVNEWLRTLSPKHDLYVVTARQFEEMAFHQVSAHGWDGLFKGVLVTNAKVEKNTLIKDHVGVRSEDWMVGDTGKDIQTGKSLGIRTAAVTSGFLNGEKLAGYEPDILVESVLDLHF